MASVSEKHIELTKVVLELEPEEAVVITHLMGRICGVNSGARGFANNIHHAMENTRYGFSKHKSLYEELTENCNSSVFTYTDASKDYVRRIVDDAASVQEWKK